MEGRVVLVTGATGGIGLATAEGLARLGATVVLSGRRREAAERAVLELRGKLAGSGAVDFVLGDLVTKEGVRAVARGFVERFAKLDVLVNNAGLMASRPELSADGIETGFAVNVLAPLLLTYELRRHLARGERPRVVTVTGGSHPAKLDVEDLEGAYWEMVKDVVDENGWVYTKEVPNMLDAYFEGNTGKPIEFQKSFGESGDNPHWLTKGT